ncbi:MAG TPA: choice-of-anchor Q domain-containing protein, partial [Polyangia bacterium]|nr:choice-of-anchor Q domain-containing protein [Polyangia bacterium]
GMSAECNMYHPATPLCGPNGGCVECLTNDNCDAVHKTCSPTNTCVPCVDNSDCASGLCKAGACADKTMVVYVDNATGHGCSDAAGAGTFAMPFCTLQKGLNAGAMASKPVVVFAGTYPENVLASISLNGGNDYVVTLVGIGGPVIKPSSSGPAFSVAGTSGKQVTASVDGFVLDGSTLTDGSNVIECSGNSGGVYGGTLLTMTRSTIKNGSGVGLSTTQKCVITFDADIFTGNKAGAALLSATDFAFTNLLVHDNGGSGASCGGISLASAGETGKMTMFNLTIVNNTAMTGALASGMLCAVSPTNVTNTLILGNSPLATEVNTNCHPDFSAFLGATGSNNETIPATGCGVNDLLADPPNGDYRPKKMTVKPCTLIDQGTNTGAPDHDLAGTSRPQPASGTDDIGAYEAK